MLRPLENLKQSIAIGTMLLSLSMLAQNGGFYCYLGVCEAELVAATDEVRECCHHHACHHAPHESEAPDEEHGDHHDDSCPCPESCWCHQAPEPYEQSKSWETPLELALQGLVTVSDDVAGGLLAGHDDTIAWWLPPDVGDASAVCRCAKLCRFLI